MAGRFCGPDQPYEGLVDRAGTGWKWTGDVRLLPEKLEDPVRWTRPRLIFVNSMADLFHRKVPDDFILDVFRTMARASHHTFQVLTKRAARMEQWFGSTDGEEAARLAAEQGITWPLKNVWLGVSVENQTAADTRVVSLLRSPAYFRFLSCEPLIGSVTLQPLHLSMIDQMIVGCQTGPRTQVYPMDEDWVRALRDQCTQHQVAFFYKQKLDADGIRIKMPLLDGREWAEYPDGR